MESGLGANMIYEVMLNTNYKDIKALCKVNKDAYEIYRSNKFWQDKFLKDFGKLNSNGNEWRQEYKIRYAILNPQKLYRLECVECNPDRKIINLLNLRVKNKQEAYIYIAHICNNKLIDERYIKSLAYQGASYETIRKIFDIEQLLSLCEKYYLNNKEKIDQYDVGGDPITFLAEHCYLGYLRPKMLFYKHDWMIADNNVILDLFNYLYSQRFCTERVKEPPSLPIDSQLNFTPDDIELMLNNRNAYIYLIEEQCITDV